MPISGAGVTVYHERMEPTVVLGDPDRQEVTFYENDVVDLTIIIPRAFRAHMRLTYVAEPARFDFPFNWDRSKYLCFTNDAAETLWVSPLDIKSYSLHSRDPRCDICHELQGCTRIDCNEHAEDWNEETGNHISCEYPG